MPLFRRVWDQLIACFSPCFGRRTNAQLEALESQADETPEEAVDCSARELSCSSLRLDVCVSPELLDEVVSLHCPSWSEETVPSRCSPLGKVELSPHSVFVTPVSLSSFSQVTEFPDLQMEDVEDEELEDMEEMSDDSSIPQVMPLPDLQIIDLEETDWEQEVEKTEEIQPPITLALTRPRPLEPRMAWVEGSEKKEEKKEDTSTETEVTEFKDEEETRDSGSSSPKKEEQQPQSGRNVSLVLFTWAEKRVNERVEKTMKKEREKREREMLHHRYVNSPRLRHLKVNRYNPNYGS